MPKKKKHVASYVKLAKSGELAKRVDALYEMLEACNICPRQCSVDRMRTNYGDCGCGDVALVSSVCDHHGEEPPISGFNGSGTVFFGSCNLRCVFCQNHQISQPQGDGGFTEMDSTELAINMMRLQKMGCHNINFVSPTHFAPQMVAAVADAQKMGLTIPIVYNSNGYDSVDVLELLDGVVDIYMPDLKYADEDSAAEYSDAPNYFFYASRALKEMFRQVGPLQMDENGVAYRGLIVRHLVLPNDLAASAKVLKFIAEELSPDVFISLMSQYRPVFKAARIKKLSRKVRMKEYQPLIDLLEELGMENGYVQDLHEAPDFYLPDFDKDHPFEDS